jgi:prepilin-type N-terminal cleavage/methylation domain-containing protein
MKKAFTLIELLIVIAIIAILALIAIPNFLEAQTRANVSRAKADMRSLAAAIESYTVDNRVPPLVMVKNSEANYGYRYCNYSWELFCEYDYPIGNPYSPDCAFALTTPIAYMTGRPPMDPFFQHTESDVAQPRRGSYLFFNPQVMYYAVQSPLWAASDASSKQIPLSPFIDVKFNSSDSPKHNINWALASPGPDRTIRDPTTDQKAQENLIWFLFLPGQFKYWQNGGTALYDPTNGTNSTGNLWRLSSGAL